MLLGQTLDGMRVWDVQRAVEAIWKITNVPKTQITLDGQGVMGGIVLYASLFEPDIKTINLQNPPSSHDEGPMFLNILRHTDIPQIMSIASKQKKVRLFP